MIQVRIQAGITFSLLIKNEAVNIAIAIGNDKYPKILWATFQVSSSRTVQGSLSPKYLLKGILVARLPKTIINRAMIPTMIISSVFAENKYLVGDNVANIAEIVTMDITNLIKNRMVLTFGLFTDSFAISGALISMTTDIIITTAPTIDADKLLLGIAIPKSNTVTAVAHKIPVKSNTFMT